jgi:NADPH2:quinone reductase
VVTLAGISITQEEAELAKLRNLTISYELMLTPMHFKMHQARINQRDMLVEAAKLIDAGKIKVAASNVFSLEDIGKAHEVIEAGHSTGKNAIKII